MNFLVQESARYRQLNVGHNYALAIMILKKRNELWTKPFRIKMHQFGNVIHVAKKSRGNLQNAGIVEKADFFNDGLY